MEEKIIRNVGGGVKYFQSFCSDRELAEYLIYGGIALCTSSFNFALYKDGKLSSLSVNHKFAYFKFEDGRYCDFLKFSKLEKPLLAYKDLVCHSSTPNFAKTNICINDLFPKEGDYCPVIFRNTKRFINNSPVVRLNIPYNYPNIISDGRFLTNEELVVLLNNIRKCAPIPKSHILQT